MRAPSPRALNAGLAAALALVVVGGGAALFGPGRQRIARDESELEQRAERAKASALERTAGRDPLDPARGEPPRQPCRCARAARSHRDAPGRGPSRHARPQTRVPRGIAAPRSHLVPARSERGCEMKPRVVAVALAVAGSAVVLENFAYLRSSAPQTTAPINGDVDPPTDAGEARAP